MNMKQSTTEVDDPWGFETEVVGRKKSDIKQKSIKIWWFYNFFNS